MYMTYKMKAEANSMVVSSETLKAMFKRTFDTLLRFWL